MTELQVAISRSGERYRLLCDVDFPEFFITVPHGFITDFASVPKFLWSIFPPTGYYQKAALLHDWCYTMGPKLAMTRWDADAAFLKQMKLDGVGRRSRYTLWLAVRLFGGNYWSH